MRIYVKNKFPLDPIWNDGALHFFEECHPNRKKEKQEEEQEEDESIVIWNELVM